MVVFCSGLVVFCSVLVGSSPVSSTLVGSCLICSALVGSCPVCSALLGFCPVCSALVLCPADSVSVPSLSISTWTWTSDPPPVPPLLHRLLDYIKIGSSVSRSLGGGSVTNPGYELPSTHHQRSPAHHMDSCTTQTVTCHSGLHLPSSIALIAHTLLDALITQLSPITRSPKSYYTHTT